MRITISQTITILADSERVFSFLADLRNDVQWRREINRTEIIGVVGPGAEAKEYSRLSRKVPDHLRVLTCAEYLPGSRVVFRSAADDPFYLTTTREVDKEEQGATRVRYTLEFDSSIVRFALGFPLPLFLVRMVARKDMKAYLHTLKAILERQAAQ